MSVTTTWYDTDRTIIHVLFEEPCVWADFIRSMDEFVAMTQSVDHDVACVCIIFEAWLHSGSPFSRFRAFMLRLPSNVGMVVVIVGAPFIDAFFQIYRRFAPKLHLVNILDEAIALVQQ